MAVRMFKTFIQLYYNWAHYLYEQFPSYVLKFNPTRFGDSYGLRLQVCYLPKQRSDHQYRLRTPAIAYIFWATIYMATRDVFRVSKFSAICTPKDLKLPWKYDVLTIWTTVRVSSECTGLSCSNSLLWKKQASRREPILLPKCSVFSKLQYTQWKTSIQLTSSNFMQYYFCATCEKEALVDCSLRHDCMTASRQLKFET
jgi:hypothetical protein